MSNAIVEAKWNSTDLLIHIKLWKHTDIKLVVIQRAHWTLATVQLCAWGVDSLSKFEWTLHRAAREQFLWNQCGFRTFPSWFNKIKRLNYWLPCGNTHLCIFYPVNGKFIELYEYNNGNWLWNHFENEQQLKLKKKSSWEIRMGSHLHRWDRCPLLSECWFDLCIFIGSIFNKALRLRSTYHSPNVSHFVCYLWKRLKILSFQ